MNQSLSSQPTNPPIAENQIPQYIGQGLLTDTLNMPWAAVNEIRRLIASPFYLLLFHLFGVKLGKEARIYGMPRLQRFRGSRIVIGERAWLRSWGSSNPLSPLHPVVFATRNAAASIKIGNDVGLTGTTIVSAASISIGNRVLVGANTTIVDTDFHPIQWAERQRNSLNGKTAPILIEDDVFIGMNSLILKGVHIGLGAMVGAGSVVVRDVPSYAIVAGNPADVIRLEGTDRKDIAG